MFKNKKILIILPYYFGYQNQIKNHLVQRGADVYLINEDVNEFSFYNKFISIYNKGLYNLILRKYYKEKFLKIPNQLDSILIIKGSTISEQEILYLKNKYPKVKLIMYQWDSVTNYSKATQVAQWCDINITFDPIDAIENHWRYRALFFDPDMCNNKEQKSIDISYICSVHSDRVHLYNEVIKFAKKHNLIFFNYLFSNRWSFYRQKYFKKNKSFMIKSSQLKFTPLSSKKTAKIYDKSKAVLDFKFTNQVGLTIRTIESIGHKCKLITNNKQIIKEDFYNPNNIYIYDIENFNIPISFFQTSYIPVSKEIYYKYSIDGWLDDVFEGVFL